MSDTKIGLSACIIAYNEEALIGRCLDSLDGIVDEIIVVHDGPCSDKTLEIAARYNARIIVAEHRGYMEAHLPRAYTEAQGEWLLRIDADEFLSTELRKALPELLKRPTAAYEFLWRLHDGERYISLSWPYKQCLFRKDCVSFIAIPHFISEVQGVTERLPFLLEHQPRYNNYSFKTFRTKWLAMARIVAAVYGYDFNMIPRFNNLETQWPKNILWRRRFPLLIMPFDAVFIFIKTLGAGWREPKVVWRVALLHAGFRSAVDWQIFKRKNIA